MAKPALPKIKNVVIIKHCHCEEPAAGDEAISAEVLTEIASLRRGGSARNDKEIIFLYKLITWKKMGQLIYLYLPLIILCLAEKTLRLFFNNMHI